MTKPLHPETLTAKAGYDRDRETGAIVPPIHLSTTYARDGDYQLIGGRDYTRDKNPTVLSAEHLLCELEGGAAAAWPGPGVLQ